MAPRIGPPISFVRVELLREGRFAHNNCDAGPLCKWSDLLGKLVMQLNQKLEVRSLLQLLHCLLEFLFLFTLRFIFYIYIVGNNFKIRI